MPMYMDMQQWMACLTGSCPQRWFLYLSWLPNNKHMTVQEQSIAQSFLLPDLKSSVWCVWVSVDVRRECLQGCQRRFKIFSLLSAPTHFSLCTTAQICKSISSECRAPDQLQFIPFSSVLLSALTVPLCSFFSLLLYTHPPFSTAFGFLFALSCSVHGVCPHWGVVLRCEDFYQAPSRIWLSNKALHSFNLERGPQFPERVH